MIARLVIVSVLASTPLQGQQAPTVFPSPRLAAVAFAIQNGFEVARTNLVVANEVTFGGIADVPRPAFDRRTMLPLRETLRDAQAIAKLLGPNDKTGWAKDLLICPEGRNCRPSTTASVLVIEELANGPGIFMKLYSPATKPADGATLYGAIVDTEQQGSGWIAARFSSNPRRRVVR